MEDLIIKKLASNINKSNENKSSHWNKYLNKELNFKDKFESFGFGEYTKKNYKNIFHTFLQRIIFGKEIFKTKTYGNYKKIFDQDNRFIDSDTIRHIFTFEKLKEIINPKKICIIGDGKINGVLGAHLTFPNAIIFSVNLSETLIHDYIILKNINISLKNSIELIDNLNFKLNNKQLFLVPSNLKSFLFDRKIDLFINIASFQEMNINEINEYFKIIKNNKSKLYCCNREYKKLIGGEELQFDKYPWGIHKKYFWENCSWHQKFYTTKPPFIRKYAGNIKHCLIDYS